ncbi:hypothetical protein [Nonomuraea sp. NEAU-A123]|uniref:hypothetical protein n=1 Tax=Nonomuraea sp. NEAU-A123 TaxID=2839649 RepID=UPI001BE476BC|nr:hypothetical protein [Nonomuraea sp. NEAU-A123]MBT2226049.1 hypothetical protein [Nonomuraea sp. NEAU-A123]
MNQEDASAVGEAQAVTSREKSKTDSIAVKDPASEPATAGRSVNEKCTHSVHVQIEIEGYASEAARDNVTKHIQRYAKELADKIREVERGDRVAGADNPEVTASTVIKASERLTRQRETVRSSPLDLILSIVSPISSGAAGILGSYLSTPLNIGVFGAVAAIAVISTTALVLKKVGDRNG